MLSHRLPLMLLPALLLAGAAYPSAAQARFPGLYQIAFAAFEQRCGRHLAQDHGVFAVFAAYYMIPFFLFHWKDLS